MSGRNGFSATVIDGVATIVLDDEASRNSLSTAVVEGLIDEFERLSDRSDADVVVLGHTGPAFSAGHDLREMADRDIGFYQTQFERCSKLMQLLHLLPQPVIARVDGVATAAGCQLVASCDLAIASDRSSFATPGVRIGLFCSTPMVALSRAVGRKRALQMLLTGDPIDASTAADWGLINTVVATDALHGAVDDLAQRLRLFSPHTIGLGKRAFYEQLDRTEAGAYDHAGAVMSRNAADPVAAEGIDAFLQKRDPRWPSGT